MSKSLKNHVMTTVGIAIFAMLVGSNVEYAINNYGILAHNLSYAVLSSTGGTGGGGTDTGGTDIGGTDEPGIEDDDTIDDTTLPEDGETEANGENNFKWDRVWDHCTFKKDSEYTIQFGSKTGITCKKGQPIDGLKSLPRDVGEGKGRFKSKREAKVECADRELPAGEKMV